MGARQNSGPWPLVCTLGLSTAAQADSWTEPALSIAAGALQRLLPTARERGEVLSVVARECQAAGQSDWAIELFLAGGQAAAALHIICHQLALLVPAALTDTRRGERRLWLLTVRRPVVCSWGVSLSLRDPVSADSGCPGCMTALCW